MKQYVQIFLTFILIFFLGCGAEEKESLTVQDKELVEVYVQISLIKDSNLSNPDKNLLIDKFLSEKNLTMEKIDLRLETYRANPAEWRNFFMNVQSRLKELQRESREKTLDESESVNLIVDTVTAHTDPPILNADSDTIIKSSSGSESEAPVSEELTDSRIAVEDDTTIIEPIPSPDYPEGSFESDELGLFLYEIQPGDNLSTLAGLYDVETEQLVIINGILSANAIRIGQKILIPNKITNIILHTIASGDVLSKISVRYNSDLEQIIQINKISNVNAINLNDLLYIPVRKTETEGNK